MACGPKALGQRPCPGCNVDIVQLRKGLPNSLSLSEHSFTS